MITKEDKIFIAALVFTVVVSAVILITAPLTAPASVEFDPIPAPAAVQEPTPYIVPDPCGLEVVVCDGEVEKPITPYVRPSYRIVTAYSSEVGQTDASPCIAADGSDICKRAAAGETLCAANFVPFGTLLILDNQEESDGEDAIVCVVADRMASRFPDRVDLYFQNTDQAIAFGSKALYVREYVSD